MPGKAPVILIVDDVKTNLLIPGNIPGKEGFEVIEASDGITSREIAAVQKPDFILLDIMMPKEDGFLSPFNRLHLFKR